MKKKFLFLFCWILSIHVYSQTINEKYWNYRHRLVKDFVYCDDLQAGSIPMSSRSIGYAWNGVEENSEGFKPSRIFYSDATIYLGHYITVLSTEYLNLSSASLPFEQTNIELYYALETINRLDQSAESYFSNSSTSTLNGFMLRDDIPHDWKNMYSMDYSIAFDRPCDFIRSHSDFNPVNIWYDEQYAYGEEIEFNHRNKSSIDQMTSLLLALRCVYEFYPDQNFTIESENIQYNFKNKAKQIANRLLNSLIHIEEVTTTSMFIPNTVLNIYPYILQPDGDIVPEAVGGNFFLMLPMLMHLGVVFENQQILNVSNYPPSQVIVHYCMSKQEVLAAIEDPAFQGTYPGCVSELDDFIDSSEEHFFSIFQMPYFQLENLLSEFDTQNIDIGLEPVGTECFFASPVLNSALYSVTLDIKNFDCIGEAEVIRDILNFSTFEFTLISDILNPLLFVIPICPHLKEDNVHMLLELAVASKFWSAEYIYLVASSSQMIHYSLLQNILNDEISTIPESDLYNINSLLSAAPCEGPYSDPLDRAEYLGVDGWRTPSKIFHPTISSSGDPEFGHRGEFNGLDYMYYFNTLSYLQGSQIPRQLSCNCVESITVDTYSNEAIIVTRKFESYKSKGISIESFLNQSLTLEGSAADLIVKNDLIVCRENPDVQTHVQFNNGADLLLHEGNTLTVERFNILEFDNGCGLTTGLYDDGCCAGVTKIVLKEGAELIFNTGSHFDILAHCDIEIGEGARIIIDGSVMTVSGVTQLTLTQSPLSEIRLKNASTLTVEDPLGYIKNTMENANFKATDSELNCQAINFLMTDQSILTLDNSTMYSTAELGESKIELYSASMLNVSSNGVFETHGGQLLLREGSEFTLDNGNLYLYDQASIRLNKYGTEESSPVFYHNGGQMILEGEETIFGLEGGLVEVAADVTFTFDHPTGPSGYMLIGAGIDHEINLNEGSALSLYGDNEDGLVLKVMDYANLWLEDSDGYFSITNGLVNMNENGQIWVGPESDFNNVRFIDWDTHNGEASVQSWISRINFLQCQFDGVHVETFYAPLTISQSDFLNNKSYVIANGGNYNIQLSHFQNGFVHSSRLDRVSYITQSIFIGPTTTPSLAIADNSIVDLICENNEISFYKGGIGKTDGRLLAKCNTFVKNTNAIFIDRAFLSMSEKEGTGYNIFMDNRINVNLSNATGISIYAGNNDFSSYDQKNIIGTLQWSCFNTSSGCYGTEIPADFNKWKPSPTNPVSYPLPGNPANQAFDCFVNTSGSNFSSCPTSTCGISVVNANPITGPIVCKLTKPVIKADKIKSLVVSQNESIEHGHSRNDDYANSGVMQLKDLEVDLGNPIISTSNFDNIALDSALTFAASYLEQYDSLGNNGYAVELFHEILTSSGLDRSNIKTREMMSWGAGFMKSAIEDMFTAGELSVELNQVQFENPVQQYVNVLNVMTDTVLTQETYKDQFYIELNKGQLFKTIDKPTLAMNIFTHLDDCELDSLEQVVLDYWKAQVLTDMDITTLLSDGTSFDSLGVDLANISEFAAEEYITSDYYFGVWILSPSVLNFVNCGSNATYRDLQNQNVSAEVFPNPANDLISIRLDNFDSAEEIAIYNTSGQIIWRNTNLQSANEIIRISLPQPMSPGTYFIRITSKEFVIEKPFQKL